jgi:hypothetical protein
VFLALLNFSTKINMLRALDFKVDTSLKAELGEMLTQAEEINTERNRLIHADYRVVGPDDNLAMMTSRLRDAHKFDQYREVEMNFRYASFFNVEEITELANDAGCLAMAMLQFSEKFNPGGS